MERLDHHSDCRAHVLDSEIILIAVVSAKYFQNHHERAVCSLRETRYLSGWLEVTRFNRRLHTLADWLAFRATILGELLLSGDVFVNDSMPIPVCRRARARRCGKVRGRAYCGYCAAKKEPFFGWRLHLICTPSGIPVSFRLMPTTFHDRTPIHELAIVLPPGARLFGDKAYNSRPDATTMLDELHAGLVQHGRCANMQPHAWFIDALELREYRHMIETVNSQCEKMGLERLYAQINPGLELKV